LRDNQKVGTKNILAKEQSMISDNQKDDAKYPMEVKRLMSNNQKDEMRNPSRRGKLAEG
jgi:hypothetical protein